MIVVAAHVTTKKDKKNALVEGVQECIRQTRKEAGNISYTLLTNTESDCKFIFFEEWESQKHLDLHMQAPHFLQLRTLLDDVLEQPLQVDLYDAQKLM